MKSLNQIMQGIALVGQLGFGMITPPLVLIWLAHLAQTKLGWGMWTMVAAILIGLVTAAAPQLKSARMTAASCAVKSINPSM